MRGIRIYRYRISNFHMLTFVLAHRSKEASQTTIVDNYFVGLYSTTAIPTLLPTHMHPYSNTPGTVPLSLAFTQTATVVTECDSQLLKSPSHFWS